MAENTGLRSSRLEALFRAQIEQSGLPAAVPELRFHPTRRWRFDFAWPRLRVAVEIEGGTYSHTRGRKSRHLTAGGFCEDCRKYAEAAILGWAVVRVDSKMVRRGEAVELTTRALAAAQKALDQAAGSVEYSPPPGGRT